MFEATSWSEVDKIVQNVLSKDECIVQTSASQGESIEYERGAIYNKIENKNSTEVANNERNYCSKHSFRNIRICVYYGCPFFYGKRLSF